MVKTCLSACWALALGLSAVSGQAQTLGNGYEISGQDIRLASQKIYLLRPGHPLALNDSVQADATGRFVLRGVVPAPDIYLVRVGQEKFLHQVPLANQEKLNAQLGKLIAGSRTQYDLTFGGSAETALWQQVQLYKYFELKQKVVPADNRALRELAALLRVHSSSYLAPYLAYNYLRLQPSTRPLLDSLTTRFSNEQPTSLYLPRLRELLGVAAALDVGALAPDLVLPTEDGQLVRLSSLRGKYVLVDFWASWCKPCRAENPTVLAAYQKFKDKAAGFTVYAVSLDTDRAKWMRATKEDSLPWAQVSDLEGQTGASSKQYAIWALPTTFLLDPSGKIIAKNLRGHELSRELSNLLR